MNRINKIIDVNPYTILLDWNNGEKKLIDFKEIFRDCNGIYKQLLLPEIFTKVQTNGRIISNLYFMPHRFQVIGRKYLISIKDFKRCVHNPITFILRQLICHRRSLSLPK